MSEKEETMSARFLEHGFVIDNVACDEGLVRIREFIAETTRKFLKLDSKTENDELYDHLHHYVDSSEVNDLRLHIYQTINAEDWLRPTYFRLAQGLIEAIVGNELCMQKRINLSIQMPNDDTSVLPIHADTWSGDSPFEVVVWLPLVDVFKTKCMFLAPPIESLKVQNNMAQMKNSKDLLQSIKPHLQWVEMNRGKILIFNQNLMHGNELNEEATTRWSLNCRFKSLLSPFADKKLGEFFEPITIRPATRFAMKYKLPEFKSNS